MEKTRGPIHYGLCKRVLFLPKRLSSDATRAFFERRDEQNKVKTEIVVDFFKGYVPIVLHGAAKVRYVDLFAGRGYYDGCNVTGSDEPTDATPLAILRAIIADPKFASTVSAWFNEGEPQYFRALQAAATALPGYGTIVHRPAFTNFDVQETQLASLFGHGDNIPTFAFIDPYGYRGLTRELVGSLLKDWGCDVAFFFNYRRVNMGLGHELFDEHFEKIFGESRLTKLRAEVDALEGEAREAAVMAGLRSALREIGARHVLTFRFRASDGRTSHHLIFASKHSRGYHTMRDKMIQHSAKDSADIAYFEFVAGNALKPTLFDTAVVMPPRTWPYSVKDLAAMLYGEQLGAAPCTFDALTKAWLLREELPYQPKHYRLALWLLLGERRVRLVRPDGTQPKRGQVPADTRIEFI